MIPQDLHIHTIYSKNDPAVVPQQTMQLISDVKHARIIGISDHLEHMDLDMFEEYKNEARSFGFRVGTEVDGPDSVDFAIEADPDYYIYHCYDTNRSYTGVYRLLDTEKPVIIAHPLIMNTNLEKLPSECFIEISNRYVWKSNWQNGFMPYRNRFRFVFSSDAHQPLMLNQTIARYVGRQLGIVESFVFSEKINSQKEAVA
jgi:hypothetical protein